jgi:hypothetical protein
LPYDMPIEDGRVVSWGERPMIVTWGERPVIVVSLYCLIRGMCFDLYPLIVPSDCAGLLYVVRGIFVTDMMYVEWVASPPTRNQ